MSDPIYAALYKIEGLTFADCCRFFDSKATVRDHHIASLVDTDDELEVDNALISEPEDGSENGAWVNAWVWVSFSGVEGLDKDPET